ncbi:MAG: MFS transporter [Thermoanaerobaculaceae bacterium]
MEQAPSKPFPRVFWTANVVELFERAAYYSMASFVVLYLAELGMGEWWPSFLNSSLLWGLVYILPVLSGTIADQVGFKRSLLVAFVLLAAGYTMMGFPVWFGGKRLAPVITAEVTAGMDVFLPIILAIVLIGCGGSVIKPCISGTVQKSHAGRATLAFAIFYMVINIGSLVGRITAYFVRTSDSLAKDIALSSIFAVAAVASVVAFFVVLVAYREPAPAADAPARPRRKPGEIVKGMFTALLNPRFSMFLLVISGFYVIYNQVYNVLPLYTKRVLEANPAMDIYTMANPLVIVTCQLLIVRLFGKMKPIRSIIVGILIVSASMAINLIPVWSAGGPRAVAALGLPFGSVFIVMTVALIAFGELFKSPRTYEYVGAMAPKGQEGLFLGYVNLPMAIGVIIGGPLGAAIFNRIMCHNSRVVESGLLELDPLWNTVGWLLLMGVGLLSALSMWLFNRWLEKHPAPAG